MIGLNEAVTLLMSDGCRTALQEIGRIIKAQNELRVLAFRCHEALKHTAVSRTWLYKLQPNFVKPYRSRKAPIPQYWPPDDLIDRLGDRDPGWPECILAIFDAAIDVRDKHAVYDEQYACALNSLIEAGRQGAAVFHGSRSSSLASRTLPIPASYFTGRITIDGDRKNLISSWRSRSAKPGFLQTVRNFRQDEIETYYDVQVEYANIDTLLRLRQREAKTVADLAGQVVVDDLQMPRTDPLSSPKDAAISGISARQPKKPHYPSDEALRQWFEEYAKPFDQLTASKRPSPDAGAAPLKTIFPDLKDCRGVSRRLHKVHRPRWKIRGAPKKYIRE